MKKLLSSYFYSYISLFPVVLFLWMRRFGYSWIESFMVGGIFSLGYLVYLWSNKKKIDHLQLSLYCFLIGGACLIFKIPALNIAYRTLKQSIIFVWLIIIGMVTTIFTQSGFIDVKKANKRQVVFASLLLILTSILLLPFSFYVKNYSTFLATSGGILLFVLIREQIRKNISLF